MTCSPSIFGAAHSRFCGYQDDNLKLAKQQYRAWSEFTDMHAALVAKAKGFEVL